MSAYLTDDTRAADTKRSFRAEAFAAAKLYPTHATTNSVMSSTDVVRKYSVL